LEVEAAKLRASKKSVNHQTIGGLFSVRILIDESDEKEIRHI